jgi:hypothetical protein
LFKCEFPKNIFIEIARNAEIHFGSMINRYAKK